MAGWLGWFALTVAESSAGSRAARRPVIEFRIHGVSGTSPEGLLDVPLVERVAGDGDAGFWRAAPTLVAPSPVREGYRWGGLTSRTGWRAAWVLLAPFAIANAAAAMHVPDSGPAAKRRGIARGAEGAVVRVIALSLTLMLVLAAFVTAVDVVGWQCGNSEVCRTGHTVTRFLGWSWMDTPGKRLAVTAFGPLVVIGVLWLLARKTWQRYEAYPAGSDVGRRQETPFDEPSFWDGRQRTQTLRRLHIAGAFAMCAGLLAYAQLITRERGATAFWPGALGVLAGAVALAVVVLVAIPPTGRYRSGTSRTALAAAGVLLLATLADAWFGPELDFKTHHELPGTEAGVTGLFLVQLAIILALGGVGIARRFSRKRRAQPIGLKGGGTACMATIALFLGAAFSAGVILRTADFLGKSRAAAEIDRPVVTLVTPTAITWAARGILVALAVIVLELLIVGICVLVAQSRLQHKLDIQPTRRETLDPRDDEAREEEQARRRKKVANAMTRAELLDHAGGIAGPPIVIGLGLGLATTVFAALAGAGLGPGFLHEQATDWRVWSANAGSWVIVGFAVALIGLMTRSYRDEGLRRQVGILWDLTTFWPRSAHPLAPPCYGERAVPEFASRIVYFGSGDPDYPDVPFDPSDVVVSAHSQGTIIATAALLQIPETHHVALVTYGCPLRRLYSLYFPAYFPVDTLDSLFARVHDCWRNLYRETDPIGGPVKMRGGRHAGRDPDAASAGGHRLPPDREPLQLHHGTAL
jgi:hypothetical protein